MQISTFCLPRYHYTRLKKLLLVMKLTTLMIFIGLLQVSASTYGQHMNFTAKDISIDKLFKELKKQSGYSFLYKSEALKDLPNVNVEIHDASMDEVMQQVLKDKPLDFLIIDKNVVVRRKPDEPNVAPTVQKAATIIYVGKVWDEFKKPMPGVSVRIKGLPTGVVTNEVGEFNIIVPIENSTLLFSFIGYETQELPLKDLKNPLTITMKVSNSNLDQVQVTAYGTTTKRLSTGDITTIKGEEIARSPVPNVLQAIQGRVPGMFIEQESGQPGSTYNIKIRGENTLAGNSAPLIIVDGVAYPSGSSLPFLATGIGGHQQGGNALNYLNPQMIESIDVLKDADATAIYGSRGAYGVIIITTKKGKPGDGRLDINTYTGLTVRGTSPALLNTQQYLMLRLEAFKNDGVQPANTDFDVNGVWPEDRYTNWVKEFTGNYANTTNTYATYSGGSGNINYLVGANYSVQDNIQKSKGNNKVGGFNFNLGTHSKDNKISLTVIGSYSSTVNDMLPVDFSLDNSSTFAPNAPPLYLPDGSINWDDYIDNPAAKLNLIYKNTTNNLTTNTDLKYSPVKGLVLQASLGYNVISGKEFRAEPTSFYQPGTAFFTTSTINLYNLSTWTLEPNASYNTQLGKKGTLTLTAGATLQRYINYSDATTGSDFISDALLGNPTLVDKANISTAYNEIQRKYLGYFGIISYNWDNKYLINFNGRYDGSSKFGTNNQFGSFGSVGAAYILSEESWFKNTLPFISFAKLHGSYGTVGGDGIADYLALNTFTSGSPYQGKLGVSPRTLANPNLQWEKNRKGEVGLDLEFLKGKISIGGSYYSNITSNQLVPQFLSSVTGFQSITINRAAIIKNYGYEFILNTVNIKSKNFSWTTSLNATIPRSILKSYPDVLTSGVASLEVGKSLTGVKLYNYQGVDPQTGNRTYKNRNGVISDFSLFNPIQLSQTLDKTEFVDLAPKYYAGFNNSFRYKNFSLDVLFTVTNRIGKNYLGSQSYPIGFFDQNVTTIALNRWQKPGDLTDVPKASQGGLALLAQGNFGQSTGSYSNATYARLNNLNFSYDLPPSFVQRVHLKGLRVYLQGQNLLTISKYGDLDPENLGVGLAPLRVFTAGINLTL
jgi:TonB-linked SusC/RagA family outer membrane protein